MRRGVIKGQVAVIIPVYKDILSADEVLSLRQCVTVLNKYKIIFVGPEKLNFSEYLKFCADISYELVLFDDKYFKDINGYNKLLLSTKFYKQFFQYKFILIHQLDAYVFSDRLSEWCDKNYDFIGAPVPAHQNDKGEIQFLKNYSKLAKLVNHKVRHVGNGGLALRKVKTCYWLLKMLNFQVKSWGSNNEDGFFKYWANIFFPLIRIPTEDEAMSFSIETNPAASLRKLDYTLPFGCHAFRKYDWEIWKSFIK